MEGAAKERKPLYVFVIVEKDTNLPVDGMFWSRPAARARLREFHSEYAAGCRIRRAKLTVFNK